MDSPRCIGTQLKDRTLDCGGRASIAGWKADLSATYGRNSMQYLITETLNASIANLDPADRWCRISPTSFDAGGFSFAQSTIESRCHALLRRRARRDQRRLWRGDARGETYEIRAGERGSWDDYDGDGGGNAGSQDFWFPTRGSS